MRIVMNWKKSMVWIDREEGNRMNEMETKNEQISSELEIEKQKNLTLKSIHEINESMFWWIESEGGIEKYKKENSSLQELIHEYQMTISMIMMKKWQIRWFEEKIVYSEWRGWEPAGEESREHNRSGMIWLLLEIEQIIANIEERMEIFNQYISSLQTLMYLLVWWYKCENND